MGKELRVTVLEVADPERGFLDASLSIYPLPIKDGLLPGVALIPAVTGEVGKSIALGSSLEARLTGDVAGGIALEVRPGMVAVHTDLFGEGAALKGEISVELTWRQQGEPLAVFEGPGRSTLQFKSISHVLGASADNRGSSDATWALKFEGGVLRIDAGEGDGFLQRILPGSVESNFDLVAGWSSKRGLFFGGSGALGITIPVHKAIGPVRVGEIFLQLKLLIVELLTPRPQCQSMPL